MQAAIAAIHDEARDFGSTDWSQILAFYQLLEQMSDNPMVALNRAIASHYRLDAARAHLHERAGDIAKAVLHFHAAAERTASIAERNYLLAKAARALQIPSAVSS